jgi:hypothetical protein
LVAGEKAPSFERLSTTTADQVETYCEPFQEFENNKEAQKQLELARQNFLHEGERERHFLRNDERRAE